eukprot:gnl/MRDRNA2_/MRDRNA2_33438_c0_seq1.p1 gnl/MRDRNA2_/MRDRNA2_33438_c0~~gnl/MRDRNA2_/MRDRNA2_33438_c0_seq1.p1  ORF type:complete len:539 (-),score=86.02 gnl/MRDRNA2_/MRDRNA2_33438_c0_seq1:72-1595(-)
MSDNLETSVVDEEWSANDKDCIDKDHPEVRQIRESIRSHKHFRAVSSAQETVKCPFCKIRCLVPHFKQYECNLFAGITDDLRWWALNSLQKKDIKKTWLALLQQTRFAKGILIHWDGESLLRWHVSPTWEDTFKTKAQSRYYVERAVDLVSFILAKVRLDAFEMILQFGDNPIIRVGKSASKGKNLPPLFSLCKTKGHADINFPAIVRPALWKSTTPINESRWDFKQFPAGQGIRWHRKEDKLFWRGSCTGVTSQSLIGTHPRSLLACAGRSVQDSDMQQSEFIDAGFAGCPWPKQPAWTKALSQVCKSDRVPYARSGNYKYLAILSGIGGTNRFRDFLATGSLNLRWYLNPELYEHFFVGLANGVHLFDVDAGLGLKDVIDFVGYARTHDKEMQQIAKQAETYIRWAFADATLDCYIWKLLDEYQKRLGYSVASNSFIQDLNQTKLKLKVRSTQGYRQEHFNKQMGKGNRIYERLVQVPSMDAHEEFRDKCASIIRNSHRVNLATS